MKKKMAGEDHDGERLGWVGGLSEVKAIEKVTEQQLLSLNNPLSIIPERSHCQLNIQHCGPYIIYMILNNIKFSHIIYIVYILLNMRTKINGTPNGCRVIQNYNLNN